MENNLHLPDVICVLPTFSSRGYQGYFSLSLVFSWVSMKLLESRMFRSPFFKM